MEGVGSTLFETLLVKGVKEFFTGKLDLDRLVYNPFPQNHLNSKSILALASLLPTCYCLDTSTTMYAWTSKKPLSGKIKKIKMQRKNDELNKPVITIYRAKQNNTQKDAKFILPSSWTHQQCVPCVQWSSCAGLARGDPSSGGDLCADGFSSDARDPHVACCQRQWRGAECIVLGKMLLYKGIQLAFERKNH